MKIKSQPSTYVVSGAPEKATGPFETLYVKILNVIRIAFLPLLRRVGRPRSLDFAAVWRSIIIRCEIPHEQLPCEFFEHFLEDQCLSS